MSVKIQPFVNPINAHWEVMCERFCAVTTAIVLCVVAPRVGAVALEFLSDGITWQGTGFDMGYCPHKVLSNI
jgi:hypothetical protein